MLRQSQLPPRPPLRPKEISYSSHEPDPTNPSQENDVLTKHRKSHSHGSASDSLALHLPHNDDDNSASDGSGGGLESACVYGPNSPRKKLNVDFAGKHMFTALSDCASQTQLPFLQELSGKSWPGHLDSWGNGDDSVNEMNAEPNEEKRYPRLRSRVRKLQYIAELEKTVDALQALESELQYEVSSVLQQRLTLSLENGKLKQHMSQLQHKKLVLDSEHQMLGREAERLRSGLARLSSQNNVLLNTRGPRPSSNHVKASEDQWEMLDWAQLSLG